MVKLRIYPIRFNGKTLWHGKRRGIKEPKKKKQKQILKTSPFIAVVFLVPSRSTRSMERGRSESMKIRGTAYGFMTSVYICVCVCGKHSCSTIVSVVMSLPRRNHKDITTNTIFALSFHSLSSLLLYLTIIISILIILHVSWMLGTLVN